MTAERKIAITVPDNDAERTLVLLGTDFAALSSGDLYILGGDDDRIAIFPPGQWRYCFFVDAVTTV